MCVCGIGLVSVFPCPHSVVLSVLRRLLNSQSNTTLARYVVYVHKASILPYQLCKKLSHYTITNSSKDIKSTKTNNNETLSWFVPLDDHCTNKANSISD